MDEFERIEQIIGERLAANRKKVTSKEQAELLDAANQAAALEAAACALGIFKRTVMALEQIGDAATRMADTYQETHP